MAFHFYDYETFNMSPKGGAPSQFAGITTDDDLKGSITHNFFCAPSEDVFPELGACLVTKHTPEAVLKQSVVHGEYDFVSRILNIMTKQPNTCVVGYNSKMFDDEWTRNLNYRNLLAPYEWHFKNGNSRFDAIDLMRATFGLRPDLINWPYVDDVKDGEVVGQRPTMKLEELSKANDIVHINSHDALSDVEALIALMRIVKEADPEFFNAVFDTRNKHHVTSLLTSQEADKGLIYVSRYESQHKFLSFVIPVGQSKSDKNVFWVWDTKVDPKQILSLTTEQRQSLLSMKKDELKAIGIDHRGLVKIKLNGLPTLLSPRFINKETGERSGLTAIRDVIAANRATAIELRQDLMDLVGEVEAAHSLDPLPEDFDHQLYGGGFFTPAENTFAKQFHACEWAERLELAQNSAPTERTKQLALRVIGRNAPELLTGDDLEQWSAYKEARFTGKHANSITERGADEPLTAAGEVEKLTKLRAELEESGEIEKLTVVDSLIAYFKGKM